MMKGQSLSHDGMLVRTVIWNVMTIEVLALFPWLREMKFSAIAMILSSYP